MGRFPIKTGRVKSNRNQRRLHIESLEGRRLLATYYVDANGGSDANAGTSPDQAWASLAKVNSAALVGGDAVLLRRGSEWNGELKASRSGTAAKPITIGAYGTGDRPEIFQLSVSGNHTVVEDLTVDHQMKSSDAVRVRAATGVILRDMEIRNGLNDGIDMDDADGIIMDGLYVHHFLAGSFTNQVDAHGIVATGTRGITIRNTEVHHVSGDSFQADPARNGSDMSNDILIEDSHFWTSPLDANYGSWRAGERPGENAVDTKVVKDGWDNVERMRVTIRNVVAHGWVADGYIANKAVFNMKEKIDATFDGVTVYDSEIAFRLRGNRGNADVTVHNAVVYDVDKAIRAEDNLQNLEIYNSTFGDGISTLLQFAGGDGGKGTWDLRNNAFIGSKPSVASDASNRVATAKDFVNAAARDYRLATTSTLVDAGTNLPFVKRDRAGVSRPQGAKHDVGAYETVTSTPLPPAPVAKNDSASTRSGVPVVIDVLSNDSLGSGGQPTLAIAAAPQLGTVVIGSDNTVLYTPAAGATGRDSFTYTVRDDLGRAASASVTVNVEAAQETIDFRQYAVGSYGGKQDSGSASVDDQGATIRLTGNSWKQIPYPYQVTPDTILEFDFRSSNQAEVHAIGFDADLAMSERNGFQLYGTQKWGNVNFRDYADSVGQWKHYRIPVGQFYTGSFQYLFFGNDHDVARPTSEGAFANIRVYEQPAAALRSASVDFRAADVSLPAGLIPEATDELDAQLLTVVQDQPASGNSQQWEATDRLAVSRLSLESSASSGKDNAATQPWAANVDEAFAGDLLLDL